MSVHHISKNAGFETVNLEEDRPVSSVFCCDLLSAAMSRAPSGCAWVTIITNVNTVAVAILAEASCIVLAEGYTFDENAVNAARGKITLMRSELPTYETAAKIDSLLRAAD